MDWAVPMRTMKESDKNRKSKDNREEARERKNRMYHCLKCGVIYKRAEYIYRQYRNCEEERFPRGVMTPYGLGKKDCLQCKG